jgi:KDO2-lipid IV(A) lauroyltransferase
MTESFLSYYLYRVLGSLAPLVPPRVGYRLADAIGLVAFHLYSGSATALEDNLSHVLKNQGDETTVRTTARQVFSNLSKNYFDLFRSHALSDEEISASVNIVGLEQLQQLLAQGKGLILTTGHFGPFDALGQIAPILNLKITVPAEHLQPEKLYEYVCRLRARNWITLMPVDGPLLGLFRALRRGEIVALAADRDITHSGIVVDFFGAPARLPDGHVQLALRTGAPVVTCFGLRQADNSSSLYIESPLELEETGDFEQDVRANLGKVVARMEDWIRRYPEQWLMLHPVWRDSQHGS